jgi:hypothetical protein
MFSSFFLICYVATLNMNMSEELWVDNDQGGTWTWWKAEEAWDAVWSGDWYDWRCRPHPESSQSQTLTDSHWWREVAHPVTMSTVLADKPGRSEDGHPATTSTIPQAMTEAGDAAHREAGNPASTDTRLRRPGRRQASGPRLWCHIFLNQRHVEFDLVPRLIGYGGKNTKNISLLTGAKIRVRGRGSGHKEVDGIKEAPVPLMVAVTSDGTDADKFCKAVRLITYKLQEANDVFTLFAREQNLHPSIAMENIWKYGEMSKEAESVLANGGLLGLVVPAYTSNPVAGHAFPPPIPSGSTTRTMTPTIQSMMKKHLPPKDVYTYTCATFPARPGLIDHLEQGQLQQSPVSQDCQHRGFPTPRQSDHAADPVSSSYFSVPPLLQLQNQHGGQPASAPDANSDDDAVALRCLIESEVEAFLQEIGHRD